MRLSNGDVSVAQLVIQTSASQMSTLPPTLEVTEDGDRVEENGNQQQQVSEISSIPITHCH